MSDVTAKIVLIAVASILLVLTVVFVGHYRGNHIVKPQSDQCLDRLPSSGVCPHPEHEMVEIHNRIACKCRRSTNGEVPK